jgi:hypothetical protein
MKMPVLKRPKQRKGSQSRKKSYDEQMQQQELEQVDDTEMGLKMNGYQEEDEEEEAYEEEEDMHEPLNHSNNGSRDYHPNSRDYHRGEGQERGGGGEGDYVVSRDMLSVQSDDRILSSSDPPPALHHQQPRQQQLSHSRYPQNFIESFDFDGYSPTQQAEEYHDINGR